MLLHTPVLLEEVLAGLNVAPAGCFLDATFGRGGHTQAILSRLGPQGRVLAIDRDADAIKAGAALPADSRLTLVQGVFGQMERLATEAGFTSGFNGILLDLGVSSPQLDEAARGFSFMQDGPLDMRMTQASGPSAEQWLARAREQDIARVLREFGEERFANRIAAAIVHARRTAPITRTSQLAAIVAQTVPGYEHGKHPATRTFQALRIQVNRELEELRSALQDALKLLAPFGRLCVISFHSLEDGIVKAFMQQHSQDDPVYAGLPHVPVHARAKLKRVGRAIHPGEEEIARNPRARSSIMRIAERVAA